MYKGYYYDYENEVYYLNSRYYHPSLRRFLTIDDIDYLDVEALGNLNLYAYCNNNPVMYSDPSGHIAISAILSVLGVAFAVGFGISAGFSVASEIKENGFKFKEWDYGKILSDALIGGTLSLAASAGGMLGVGMVTGWAALGLFVGTSIVSFGGGIASYSLERVLNGKEINKNIMYEEGLDLMVQGMFNFGIGMAFGSLGKWGSLGKGYLKDFNLIFRQLGHNKFVSFCLAFYNYIKGTAVEKVGIGVTRYVANLIIDELQLVF